MYSQLKCAVTIVYRFPTGELLLCQHCRDFDSKTQQHCDGKTGLAMCDIDLDLRQFQHMTPGTRYSTPITHASIDARPLSHNVREVCVSHASHEYTVNWHGAARHDPNRVVTRNTFVHGNTIVAIPHSLHEFFAMQYRERGLCGHNDVIKTGLGTRHVTNFKSKMILAIAWLRMEVPYELVSHIVMMSCHAYKDHDYVSYLELDTEV